MTRRTLLAAACAAPAFAQQAPLPRTGGPPPHPKGPKVFLDYDQIDLDAAYNQPVYAPNQREVEQRLAAKSDAVRARLGAPLRKSYGPSAIEQLDIYRTGRPSAPIHIYVHGGAWRGGSAKASGFLADLFVPAGAHYIAPDFVLAPDAGGSLMAMEDQVCRAIRWVHDNAATFGGDPERIYLSGHSSGTHLAACALTLLPTDLIKGALLVSGMYDLKGPRLSWRNTYVKFDDATEEALSPQRHIDRIHAPLIVAYGSLETPEFQRQAREFAVAVKAAGKPVELIRGEDYNHFEYTEAMADAQGQLGRATLAQMGLK